jgi:hypothetical protein
MVFDYRSKWRRASRALLNKFPKSASPRQTTQSSPPTMKPDNNLPSELIDQILDDPSIDTDSLKACALISRAWLPSARQRLFHRFSIISTKEDYQEFFEILESSPGIAHCVRHFVFTISPITFSNDWILFVSTICSKFTKVETFYFNRFPFISFRDHVNAKLLQSFRPLMQSTTKLVVDGVQFENRDHCYRFFNAFPNITHLDLHNTGFTHEGLEHWEGVRHCFDDFSPEITPSRLRYLRLDECYGDMSQLFEPSTSRLVSLTVQIRMLGRPDHPITISAFPSLEDVELFTFEQDSSVGKYGSFVL